MSSRLSERGYAVVGTGRWGTRLARILEKSGRRVRLLAVPRPASPADVTAYRARLTEALRQQGRPGEVVWFAVPPGHQDICVRCALDLGYHTVVEKPWGVAGPETEALLQVAQQRGIQVATHYPYCFLERIVELQGMLAEVPPPHIFSGAFSISTPDRLSIPSLDNLGCHLLAIREYAFPQAKIGAIETAYGTEDRRFFRLEGREFEATVDFLNTVEPLVERFVEAFERHMDSGRAVPSGFAVFGEDHVDGEQTARRRQQSGIGKLVHRARYADH